MPENNTVKPGYKTTEFWKSVAVELTGLLALFGIVSPTQIDAIQSMPEAVGGVVDTIFRAAGLFAAVISQWSYTKSRTAAKTPTQPAK